MAKFPFLVMGLLINWQVSLQEQIPSKEVGVVTYTWRGLSIMLQPLYFPISFSVLSALMARMG
jgi:hypothetical protein